MDRNELARSFPQGGVGVEVGVEKGDFAEILLNEATPQQLWLIDCWSHQEGEYEKDPVNVPQHVHDAKYQRVVSRFIGRSEVRILRAFSPEAADNFADGSLDWVYIDACHLYDAALADCRAWWAKVKPGGILAGHDYCETSWIEVKRAVDDFCGEVGRPLKCVTQEAFPSWAIEK